MPADQSGPLLDWNWTWAGRGELSARQVSVLSALISSPGVLNDSSQRVWKWRRKSSNGERQSLAWDISTPRCREVLLFKCGAYVFEHTVPPPASVLTRFPTFPPRSRASPSPHLAEIGSCRPTSHFTALRLKLLSHCGGVTRVQSYYRGTKRRRLTWLSMIAPHSTMLLFLRTEGTGKSLNAFQG